jgi:hypothetical protein
VDWPPLFDLMENRTLDPSELDFEFISPSPGVSAAHSYVTIQSAETPSTASTLASSTDGDTVTLVTENVRGMVLDGAALKDKGVAKVMVDGTAFEVAGTPIEVGPQTGKRPDAYGPLVQAFHKPFCLVYSDTIPAYRHYAAWLAGTWNIIGNGHACVVPESALTDELRESRNMIYLGVAADSVPLPEGIPFSWDKTAITVAGQDYQAAGLATVFPDGDRLAAVIVTTRTHEYLLYGIQPFSSRFWIPDWLVWSDTGANAAGFFDAGWQHAPGLSVP